MKNEPRRSITSLFGPALAVLFLCIVLASCAAKQIESEAPDQSNATQASLDELITDPDLVVEEGDAEVDEADVAQAAQESGPLTPQEEAALQAKTGIDFHLDVYECVEMQQYFTYFTRKKRDMFAMWLKRAEPFLPYVREVFKEYGLPPDLVLLPFAESGYNAWAYSRAGAAGMWQFMPFTGRKYGLTVDWWIDERRDPYLATVAAAKYLQKLHEMFGDWYLALAAYNAGEGKISRALKKSGSGDFFELTRNNHLLSRRARLRTETKHYVPKLMAIMKIFQNLEALGFEPVNWNAAPDLAEVKVPGGTDLLALATATDMKWKDFNRLNPSFRRQVSPPDKTCTVYVPGDRLQAASEYVNRPDARPYAGYSRYKVRNGDSWWLISRRSGIPVSVLKKVNRNYSNLLRPGQYVMIPGKGMTQAVATRQKTQRYAQERANYIVRSGDTLWDISRHFDVSVKTLLKANGMRSAKQLRAGQKLYIPDVSAHETRTAQAQAEQVKARLVRYRVRRGDTLWSIARRFGVSTSSLKEWNSSLGDSNLIKPGDSLEIYVQ